MMTLPLSKANHYQETFSRFAKCGSLGLHLVYKLDQHHTEVSKLDQRHMGVGFLGSALVAQVDDRLVYPWCLVCCSKVELM